MKVLNLGSLDVKEGGPTLSTYLGMKGVERSGWRAAIAMAPLQPGGRLIAEDVETIVCRTPRLGRLQWIPGFATSIEAAGEVDVVHIQGLWRLIGAQGARWARRKGIPYVVSLRGMLYPQALGQRRWFKRLSLAAYEADTLRGAAAIHATCEEEAEHYRALGFTNRVEIIPNAVDTSAVGAPKQDYADVRTIAYLGRFDGRKRIDLLIKAFAIWAKERRDCRLRLIGSGPADFEAELRSRAAAAGDCRPPGDARISQRSGEIRRSPRGRCARGAQRLREFREYRGGGDGVWGAGGGIEGDAVADSRGGALRMLDG